MQPGNSGGDRAIHTNKREKTHMITIAIPTNEGRLHGHFGGCREFTLVQADPSNEKLSASGQWPRRRISPAFFRAGYANGE